MIFPLLLVVVADFILTDCVVKISGGYRSYLYRLLPDASMVHGFLLEPCFHPEKNQAG